MFVRPAKSADIPAILAVERQAALAAHWTTAEYERIFTVGQTPRVALVAEEEGTVLGFLVGRALGPDWELENVAVAASASRRGLGARLVTEFLGIARSRGAAGVYLEVRESNEPARRLYAKLGFLEAGRRKSYYNNPLEDAVVCRCNFVESH